MSHVIRPPPFLLDNPHQLALLSAGFSILGNWCLNAWWQRIRPLLLVTGESPDRGEKSLSLHCLDYLFTKLQAFVAIPSHPVLSWKKMQLHHGSVRPKTHPNRDITAARLLPVFVLPLMIEWCYVISGVNKWTRMEPVTFSEAHMLLEILTLPPKHSNIHRQAQNNATTQW